MPLPLNLQIMLMNQMLSKGMNVPSLQGFPQQNMPPVTQGFPRQMTPPQATGFPAQGMFPPMQGGFPGRLRPPEVTTMTPSTPEERAFRKWHRRSGWTDKPPAWPEEPEEEPPRPMGKPPSGISPMSISPEFQGFAEEAKKYKSAKEFVGSLTKVKIGEPVVFESKGVYGQLTEGIVEKIEGNNIIVQTGAGKTFGDRPYTLPKEKVFKKAKESLVQSFLNAKKAQRQELLEASKKDKTIDYSKRKAEIDKQQLTDFYNQATGKSKSPYDKFWPK